ncbi:hypothetical protein NPIL_473411 [Nephila pilipes]|uniref:Uncharacterized protein n=1 Tax=Nephila pilipes TaxID=299642 RepID=A0A8X6N1G9_NEPPI|nr:hypothetical protein NPIL_473411 [Nephila pilipes]
MASWLLLDLSRDNFGVRNLGSSLSRISHRPHSSWAGFTDDSTFAFSSTAFAVEGGEEVVGSLSASHVSMFDAMSGAQYEDGKQYGPQHGKVL